MAGFIAAFFPFAGYALGLGKLTVRSALNEPLSAEIEVTSVSDKELKGLQVGLAPRSDFDQAGVERLPFLSQVKFTVSKRADGNYFIQLRTDQQIEEPFLHLLLAVEWPGGRLVREYTALIDPPVLVASRPTGIDAPQVAPSIAPAPVPVPEPLKPESVAAVPEKLVVEPVTPTQPAPVAEAKAPEPAMSQPAEVPTPPLYTPPPETTATVEPLAPVATTSPSTPSVAAGWAKGGGYDVKRGDTAWRIAEQLRTDNQQTIEQVVLALYRANPHAFFGNNVNNLKAGQILKMPESTEIEAVPAVQARTQFRAQYDAWQEYKIKLAGASSAIKVVEGEPKTPATPTTKDAAPAQKEAKKEPEKVAKAPADKTAQQDELLKIVRSTVQGEKTTPDKKPAEGEVRKDSATKEHQALADRVATLEESLASRQLETKELGEKVSQVRAQLKREARLIQLEQKDLAAAQTRAKPETAKQPELAKSAEPPKPEVKAEPAPKVEAPKPVEQSVTAPAPAPAPELPKPVPEKPAATTAPKKPVVVPPPVEEKGFFAELMDSILSGDMFLPIILGVAVLVSGVIALVYMQRRRRSIAEFEESILQSEAITGATGEPATSSDTSGQVVSTGDTSFLSDFSQGGMGNIHTDEVDPIAEAEVYLAYGRDETAEEILKEAIVRNPAREELKLKLLEIYANRSDVRAFETLAEEMYAAMGGRPSKNWPRVEDLGRKLNPENPMFRGGAPTAAAAATATVAPNFADAAKMKATLAPSTTMMSGQTNTGIISPPAPATSEPSDFDFDLGAASPPAAAETAQSFEIDLGDNATKSGGDAFDFGSDLGSGSARAGMESMEANQPVSNLVDFDFGDKEDVAVAAAPEKEFELAEAPPLTGMPAGEAGESPQWDETATKLDLARAYIDMGDSEGARSILEEVMAEGNDQQKKQAKELSAQIA